MAQQNPVVWFEIYTNDLSRAQKFYETVFQVQLTELPNPDPQENFKMLSFPGDMETKGAASGALVWMEGFEAGGNGTIVYFHSEDCVTEESRVEKAGGTIFKPKMSIGEYGFVSLVIGTEGNMIGIHSLK